MRYFLYLIIRTSYLKPFSNEMKNEIMVNNSSRLMFGERQRVVNQRGSLKSEIAEAVPEILFVTSYPPRECGIATYSQDLIKSLNNKYNNSFKISVCPIENSNEKHTYDDDIKYILDIDEKYAFIKLAEKINKNDDIKMILVQHEFGLFREKDYEFLQFIDFLKKPVILVFHTVLPKPKQSMKLRVNDIVKACKSIIVMTDISAKILVNDYGIKAEKVNVIPHGTHLVSHLGRELLKEKYNLTGKKVLSTFEIGRASCRERVLMPV